MSRASADRHARSDSRSSDRTPRRELPFRSNRGLLIGTAILLVTLFAAGNYGWRSLPDPLADASAFLAPYDEVSRRSLGAAGAGDLGLLSRRPLYPDEEARLRRMLPAARGWRVTRAGGAVFASNSGPSRVEWLRRALLFTPVVTNRVEYVSVELLPRNPEGGSDGRWTLARFETQGFAYPYAIPSTPRGGSLNIVRRPAP